MEAFGKLWFQAGPCSYAGREAGVIVDAFGDPVVKLVGALQSISGSSSACPICDDVLVKSLSVVFEVGFRSPLMLVRFEIWNVSQDLRFFSALVYGSSGTKSTWATLEEGEELTRV